MEVMKHFSDMAYMTIFKDTFDKATKILYGKEVAVNLDLSKRMMFSCYLCSKDMNAETALKQHTVSGTHQKNLDKKRRAHQSHTSRHDVKYHHKDPSYGDPKSLRSMLLTSQVKPVGLQMIEEYQERPSGGKRYYKCILCGAHGKLDSIYWHTIGNRHTEKYIKSGVVLKTSLLDPKDREMVREFLLKKEKITVSAIKTYKDRSLFPKMWSDYSDSLRFTSQRKRETQWVSETTLATPSTSRKRPHSSSPDTSSWESPSSSSSKASRNEIQQSRPRETSPLCMFRNQSPPSPSADDKLKTMNLHQSPQCRDVVKYDQSVQKFDLEELMIQFNFVVKTSHLPEFDIQTQEDVKAAIDMMFKISSALHFITKVKLENSQESSKEITGNLIHKKSLLSKIMGNIKLRMEAALLQSEGFQS